MMCAICSFEQCRDGCPAKAETIDLCPECGQECECVYVDARSGEILGCDRCIKKVEPEEAFWK